MTLLEYAWGKSVRLVSGNAGRIEHPEHSGYFGAVTISVFLAVREY